MAKKKKSDNPANQSPSPRPPLQQPTLSRMNPSKPIAGIGADSVGVREGDRAGIRSHKSANNLSQKKKGGGGNPPKKKPRQSRDNSPTELRKPSGKMRQSASVSIGPGPSRAGWRGWGCGSKPVRGRTGNRPLACPSPLAPRPLPLAPPPKPPTTKMT